MSNISAMTRGELDEAIRMEVAGMRHCDGCQTTTRHDGPPWGVVVEGSAGPHLHWPDPLTGREIVCAPTVTFLDADGTLNVLHTMRIRGFVVSLRGIPPLDLYYQDDGNGNLKQLPSTTPRWVASFRTPLNDDPPWVDVSDFDENPALAVARAALKAVRYPRSTRREHLDKLSVPPPAAPGDGALPPDALTNGGQ